MDISGNHSIHDMMYHYQRNIRDYSDNIHDFNVNMSYYLSIYANEMRFPPIARPIPTIHNVYRNLLQRRDEGDTFLHFGIRPMEDVIVRPTVYEFERATEIFLYDNTMADMTCPITLESFQENEEICRIRHCGHTFKKPAILSWFQRNVRCPVCRYDIRDYVPPTVQRTNDEEEQPQDESEFDDLVQELSREYPRQTPSSSSSGSNSRSRSTNILNNGLHNIMNQYSSNISNITNTRTQTNSLSNNLTDAIRSFINRELQHMPVNAATTELLYTFDIPIGFDSSGNYRV